MALPQTEADMKRAIEAIRNAPPDWFKQVYGNHLMEEASKGPPKLRGWPYRLWCALRGHGGITYLPGPVFYFKEGLCKRCGARVNCS